MGTMRAANSTHAFKIAMINDNLTQPFQIIKAKTQQGWTGYLEVLEPQDTLVSWRVYLLAGKLYYATCIAAPQERLNYLWQRFKLGFKCPQLNQYVSEERQLFQWLAILRGTEFERRKLLAKFIEEALIQIFSIERTSVKLVADEQYNSLTPGFTIETLTNKELSDRWRQVRTYLSSPYCRIYLPQSNALQFYKIWKELYKLPELAELSSSLKLSAFVNLFAYKNSLYQIATQANCDYLQLAERLKTCIDQQIVTLLPYSEITKTTFTQNRLKSNNTTSPPATKKLSPSTIAKETVKRPVIACIDDSQTVQKQVKMTLEAIGYQIISIDDPSRALKQLLSQQPVLMLMDINMPEIDGYDLCSMLRKSNKFKHIPIVMLTGRDGAIDRLRAKFVGSTDYLTKPFLPEQLIKMVQRFHCLTA